MMVMLLFVHNIIHTIGFTLVHTDAFTHTHTHTHTHTESFALTNVFHAEVFYTESFCTETLQHTNAFTHTQVYHTDDSAQGAFTQICLCHR